MFLIDMFLIKNVYGMRQCKSVLICIPLLGYVQSWPLREFEGSKAKEKDQAPARETSRKFPASRNKLLKNAACLLYKAPWTFKHWVF